MTESKKPLTEEAVKATKAEVSRLFASLSDDEAAEVWLQHANRLVGVYERRAAVRGVEGRGLSARDQASLASLRTSIGRVLAARDPEAIAERRRHELEAAAAVDGVA